MALARALNRGRDPTEEQALASMTGQHRLDLQEEANPESPSLDDVTPRMFAFRCKVRQVDYGVNTPVFDPLLTLLLMVALVEQARLVPTLVGTFWEMLDEDTPPNGPRLPSLTRLILLDITLTALRMCHCCDMLIKRIVELGVSLEVFDLRTCVVADRAVQLLARLKTPSRADKNQRRAYQHRISHLGRQQ